MDFAAEVRDFRGKIDDFGPLEKNQKKAIRKNLKVMCRECQMGVAAAQLALDDAGLAQKVFDPDRSGISFGSDLMFAAAEEFAEGIRHCLNEGQRFEFSRWATQGMPQLEPLWLLKYLPNMPASHVAIFNQFCGPNNSVTLREASPNIAVGEAFEIIADGRADMMLCGATGTRLYPMRMLRVVRQEEVATGDGDPTSMSRPFDRERMGMVLGEGAAAVILEDLSAAQSRGAMIYGEVAGQSSSSVADRQRVGHPDRAMRNVLATALQRAGVKPEEVGHLNAHGLSTRRSDAEEAWAINQVFGDRREPVPVVAPKSYFGNLGAGSGMVELVASLLSLNRGALFPVLNYATPDPDCPLAVVSNGDTSPGSVFVNLNATPQGQASALVIRSFVG
jgi:3-oxoacyl-[acyl-carrier-protein] synthase II